MRSFRSAIAAGCDLIECDVHLSSDGRLVVIHDHTLERTTNGTGLVKEHTAAELRKLEPRLQLGILEGARPMHPADLLREAGADVYSPHWGATDPQVVKEVHAAGGAVGVWPVDDDMAIAWCKYCKPDSIFTNRPKEVGAALRN